MGWASRANHRTKWTDAEWHEYNKAWASAIAEDLERSRPARTLSGWRAWLRRAAEAIRGWFR